MSELDKIKNLAKVKGFDIEEFDGLRSVIASVEMTDIETRKYNGDEFESQQLIVKTKNLSDDEKNPIQATEYIPLKKDKETGIYGIPENANSKAMKMLKYFKAKDFTEIIGKECQVVKRIKNDKEFLGIHYG